MRVIPIRDVARMTGRSKSAVLQWCRNGMFRTVKIGNRIMIDAESWNERLRAGVFPEGFGRKSETRTRAWKETRRRRKTLDPTYRKREQRRARQYQRANRHALRARSRQRANKKRLKPDGLSEQISLDYIFARDGGRCAICGKKVKRSQASIDHADALKAADGRRGDDVLENCVLAHKRCNSRKGNGNTHHAQLSLFPRLAIPDRVDTVTGDVIPGYPCPGPPPT